MTVVADLTQSWDFVPSQTWPLRIRRTVRSWLHKRPPPPSETLVQVRPRPEWVVYFVFLPEGQLTPAHRFTIQRVRDAGIALLTVCATPKPSQVPDELRELSDALCWKGMSGYDFSAYSIGLRLIAEGSPGATATVLNDSVFGPFHDLRRFSASPRWDLSGFTASSQVENHIQSYAFVLRDVTPERLSHLEPVLPSRYAYDDMGEVVIHQELPLARVAARNMSVGAYWYGNAKAAGDPIFDPTLSRPLELVRAGFPFIKKSLLGKHQVFQDPAKIRSELDRLGHP
jgi:hypothetical protein